MSDFSGESDFPSATPPPPPPPPNMAPPPGFVPYSPSQGAYSQFQRVGGVGRTIGILVTVLIPLQLLVLALSFAVKNKAQDFIDGTATKTDFVDSSKPSLLLGTLSFGVQIAILVLTMIWMNRMAKNQKLLDRSGTWSPGWAVAGWFLPPCGIYVIPWLMFRDLWKSSDPQSDPDWKRNRVGAIVNVWWVLFGLAPLAFIGVTVSRFRVSDDNDLKNAKDVVDSFNLSIVSGLVAVLAAVSYIVLVRQLTARHKATVNET